MRLGLHSALLVYTFFSSPSLFVTLLSSTPHCPPRCCTFPFPSCRNLSHDLQSQKHVQESTDIIMLESQWHTIMSGLHGVAAAAGEFPGRACSLGRRGFQ
ncbi:hypothetical protein CYLTODRAFT_87426 [Cylindrobasidium torrendii FP15055 ss-10]|uniref:Secreted protein n=1 Tax=Cylindrobasidium torrendii FP15055 ss-10 TaxID=1314674 RepID=A0A0D7B5G5_9AGAR|nr:hypothetical protein CYLTODRAFT_87426 [Cylindrobasidium torrendii FP15055 ss-10]